MNPLVINPQNSVAGADLAALRKAAQGFEAMFVRRMLEAARAGGDVFGSAGADQFTAMRDAHLADIAAERGAFGIADAITQQMARRNPGEMT